LLRFTWQGKKKKQISRPERGGATTSKERREGCNRQYLDGTREKKKKRCFAKFGTRTKEGKKTASATNYKTSEGEPLVSKAEKEGGDSLISQGGGGGTSSFGEGRSLNLQARIGEKKKGNGPKPLHIIRKKRKGGGGGMAHSSGYEKEGKKTLR